VENILRSKNIEDRLFIDFLVKTNGKWKNDSGSFIKDSSKSFWSFKIHASCNIIFFVVIVIELGNFIPLTNK